MRRRTAHGAWLKAIDRRFPSSVAPETHTRPNLAEELPHLLICERKRAAPTLMDLTRTQEPKQAPSMRCRPASFSHLSLRRRCCRRRRSTAGPSSQPFLILIRERDTGREGGGSLSIGALFSNKSARNGYRRPPPHDATACVSPLPPLRLCGPGARQPTLFSGLQFPERFPSREGVPAW